MTSQKIDTRKWTRNWRLRGAIPPEAAVWHRKQAEMMATEVAKQLHLAVADAWDEIHRRDPAAVREAYRDEIEACRRCAACQVPGSDLQLYWLQKSGELAVKLSAI